LRAQGEGRALEDVAVLMVHSGGDSQRSPTNSVCGKAWSALNSAHADASINTPLDLLLEQLLPLFRGVPPGSLVVASSDVLLIVPAGEEEKEQRPKWGRVQGVVGLATHVAAELGPNHGAYVMEEAVGSSSLRPVRRYLQKAPLAQLRAEGAVVLGRVAIDTGVIYLAPEAAAALAALLDEAPFSRCTARGIQGGSAPPLRLELYSDMLCALSGGMGQGREEYLRMDGTKALAPSDLQAARARLWDLMNPLPFAALAPEGARFAHLGTTAELMEVRVGGMERWKVMCVHVHSFVRHLDPSRPTESQMMTLKMPSFAAAFHLHRRVGAFLPSSANAATNNNGGGGGGDDTAVILNSLILSCSGLTLGTGAVVEHCFLAGGGRVEVGAGALVSGLAFAGRGDLKGMGVDM